VDEGFELDVRAVGADFLQFLQRHFARKDDELRASASQNCTESYKYTLACVEICSSSSGATLLTKLNTPGSATMTSSANLANGFNIVRQFLDIAVVREEVERQIGALAMSAGESDAFQNAVERKVRSRAQR
jgi:hypothetical protein